MKGATISLLWVHSPSLAMVKGIPDIYVVEEGVVGVVGDESWRWDRGLVFFVGVVVIDLQVLVIVVLLHGQLMMG